jgi:hypothetical protein
MDGKAAKSRIMGTSEMTSYGVVRCNQMPVNPAAWAARASVSSRSPTYTLDRWDTDVLTGEGKEPGIGFGETDLLRDQHDRKPCGEPQYLKLLALLHRIPVADDAE